MGLETAGNLAGTKVPLAALHSTLGRHAARAVRCAILYETLEKNYNLLIENISKGDVETLMHRNSRVGRKRDLVFMKHRVALCHTG